MEGDRPVISFQTYDYGKQGTQNLIFETRLSRPEYSHIVNEKIITVKVYYAVEAYEIPVQYYQVGGTDLIL